MQPPAAPVLKLHRCPVMFAKTAGHPCWKVQMAFDEAGVAYKIVKHPARKSRRAAYEQLTGQRILPAIELADGTIVRGESDDLVDRIRSGRLDTPVPAS